mgnify:CR=1 FL=1
MISRVTAEFESPDLAELAVKRIKESVNGIYSGSIIRSTNYHSRKNHEHSSVIPTAFNNYTNFMTAVMESPFSDDSIPEPYKRQNTSACIVCGSGAVDNVIAVMNSLGGLDVRSGK